MEGHRRTRPNQVGNPNGGPKTWDEVFQYFSVCRCQTSPQTFGGTERRGAVIGPGLWRYDMALSQEHAPVSSA